MKAKDLVKVVVMSSLALVACDTGPTQPDALDSELSALLSRNGGGPNPRPQTWVDGELFDGVVTNTAFKPTAGNFDELYMGGGGFKDGVPLISESKPGDQDYNGGRWHVNVLKAGVPADKYANADSLDDLILDDFEGRPVYFECPLLPKRGNH